MNNFLYWGEVDTGGRAPLVAGGELALCIAPSIGTYDGRLALSIGTPGSYGIMQTQVQALVQYIDFGQNIQDAIAAPRGRLWDGQKINVESRISNAVVEALKQRGGYITADVINVTPDVPGLQAMLDRFNKEHTHAEDEVRFIVKGRGVFHIHPPTAPVFSIEVEAGDLINVPAGTEHWFDLCHDRTIRAIRLFREKVGWTPVYTGNTIAERFQPLCFGPQYIPALPRIETLPAFAA
jgi:cupin superfamily acireductone dioxygenase involved in methionine salvage